MTTATRNRRYCFHVVLAASVLTGTGCGLAAEPTPEIVAEATVSEWRPAFVGVELCEASTAKLKPLEIRAARIDLKEPTINFMVTPSNGEREGEVDARRSTEFLTEFKCQLAINASFFRGEYKPKAPQDIVGLCVSDGDVYSQPEDMAALLVSKDNRVWFDDPPYERLDEAHHAVAGSSIILSDGQITVDPENKPGFTAAQHPRSAAGTTRDGRYLILMTIDGRQPGYSEGTSLIETAEWLRRLGAWDGLNLDGGGSTNLVIEDADGKPKLLNHPKSTWLRYCANHLGVYAQQLPATHAEDETGSAVTEQVIYGRKHGLAMTMDIFSPTGKANGAAVVYVVSGGWFSSRKGIRREAYSELRKRGYTVFAVVHGSQPRFTIPEAIEDLQRAVRYVRYVAPQCGCDPNRIGITGSSAGGHLSLMIAMAGANGKMLAKDPVDRQSSRVQAVACFFPPTDFLNYGRPGREVDQALESELARFKAPFDYVELDDGAKRFRPVTDPEKRRKIAREISPITHVSSDDPPTLIIHGSADRVVPFQQAEAMKDKLAEAGVPAELVTKRGAGHGWLGIMGDMKLIADWFDKHLLDGKSE